jgi:3-phosphoshikimate 1-carboxyvinyltransferase
MKLHKKTDFPALVSATLPGSKSISLRALVIASFCDFPISQITGLSDSDDTRYLANALNHPNQTIHSFGDGATPLHFFMAYAAARNSKCSLTGSERLMQRPHEDLADLLRQCGAIISLNPQKIVIERGIQSFSNVLADATRSSQHISSMMLLAPQFPGRKSIFLNGKPASYPYLKLTAEILRIFGINADVTTKSITIEAGQYKAPDTFHIEPDWSAAAFFYSLVACLPSIKILLTNLNLVSIQGDAALAKFYEELGVASIQTNEGVLITNNGIVNPSPVFDLLDYPDCAPALLASCAFLGLNASFLGLENLNIKESNRLQAMKENLAQIHVAINNNDGMQTLACDSKSNNPLLVSTYNDHRIAMAMAIFGLRHSLSIDNPECINKSFPGFWQQWAHWFHIDT